MSGKGLVIGLGTGRCGTASLAALLNAQPGTVCFHELNPSSMAWEGAEQSVGALLQGFATILGGGPRYVTPDLVSPDRAGPVARMLALDRVAAIGDVASYYLPYADAILRAWPEARMCCLMRPADAVVESFAAKLDEAPGERPRNHWAPPGDARWRADRIWDKCFPSYHGLADAPLAAFIARYVADYAARAEQLRAAHPGRFAIFPTDALNTPQGRAAILDFCLPDQPHRDTAVHRNRRAG